MADIRTTLADTQVAPEAPLNPTHVTVRREDYRPPDWLVPEIQLDFGLELNRTRVRATLAVERNGDHDRPLRLDGSELKLISVKVDGQKVDWKVEDGQLVIAVAGVRATVETEV